MQAYNKSQPKKEAIEQQSTSTASKNTKTEKQKDSDTSSTPPVEPINVTKEEKRCDSESKQDSFKENALEMATMTFKEKTEYKKRIHQQRMSDMDKKEQFTYMIRYYKWHFIIGLFAIVCLVYVGKVIYHATWPTYLELAIINNTDSSTCNTYIPGAYRQYYNLDEKNYIEIYGELEISATEDTTEVGMTMSNYQTLGYYNLYDMLDVIICDKEALKLFVSTDDTTAIDLSMDNELYSQIEEYVITMSDPNGVKNDGKPYTVALDISDTDFIKNCHLSYSEVYLLIPSTKYQDNENTINFIKFVYGL